MPKLNNLTPEQASLIPVIRNKWINKLNKPQPFDKEKAKKAVEWLYEFSRLSKPEVLFFDSPLGVQIGLNIISKKAGASVRASVRDSVWDSVRVLVKASVRDSVGASVEASVEASGNLQFHTSCFYGDCSDYNWTAFYDYFDSITILDNDNFRAWRDYCEAGIFYCVQLKGLCAVCPMPKYVKRNHAQAMHCEDGFAIEWADGYGIYVLDGIRFDRKDQDKLYWKIVKHELTLPEILAIEDIDQRAVALKYCNAEKIIADLGDRAILVDEAKKPSQYLKQNAVSFFGGIAQVNFGEVINTELTYRLYKVTIPDIFDEPEFMLVYPHASIEGLSYWKGVDPEIAKQGSLASIASHHNMSVDEYLSARSQS